VTLFDSDADEWRCTAATGAGQVAFRKKGEREEEAYNWGHAFSRFFNLYFTLHSFCQLRSVGCVFTIKIGLDWIGVRAREGLGAAAP